ncbi:MAG: TIM barrel protein [Clostridia bacterium]|nr:TIM barrel protein [Clostridia bacterium]
MIPIGICADFADMPEAKALGYDFAEARLADLAALPEKHFEEFAAWCEGGGLRVTAVNRLLPEGLNIVGPDVRAGDLHDYLSRAFARCRRLNVRVAVLDAALSRTVPAGYDYPQAWRQLGNFLRICQGHARENGLAVAVEPLRKAECNLLNLVSEATLLAGLLQLNNVGVAANTGSMAMAAEPVTALSQTGNALCHVHVEHPLTRRMPREADGEDYWKLMRVLKRNGYAGGVSVTCQKTGDFTADARAALLCLRQAQRN